MITWEDAIAQDKYNKAINALRVKESFSKHLKGKPAEALYEVRYKATRLTDDNPDKGEILEEFCQAYWGCSFDELMKYWDEYIS